MLLAEKEKQIGQQEEELRRLNQELATTQRELHSVQSTVTHRERENDVSGPSLCLWSWCVYVTSLRFQFLKEQLSGVQAEFLWKETELTGLRVSCLECPLHHGLI